VIEALYLNTDRRPISVSRTAPLKALHGFIHHLKRKVAWLV